MWSSQLGPQIQPQWSSEGSALPSPGRETSEMKAGRDGGVVSKEPIRFFFQKKTKILSKKQKGGGI